MTGVEQALLIILSSFLALFLLLAIVATVKFIQVLNSLKRIAASAEHIADKAETLSDIFVAKPTPVAFGKFLSHIAESVFSSKKKGKK